MTTVDYKVVIIRDAFENKYPDWEDWADDEGNFNDWLDDWASAIYRFEDDIAVELLSIDGGEPEDNSFTRDGAWIAPALLKAYALGVRHGVDRGWDARANFT